MVMGYCPGGTFGFLHSCPEFERMLVRSRIKVIKYWFSVSSKATRPASRGRNAEPLKRWELSDMDLADTKLYVSTRWPGQHLQYTDIKQAPWYVVPSDDKKAARLNYINHLLSQFEYEDVAPGHPTAEMKRMPYVPPIQDQTFDGATVLSSLVPLLSAELDQLVPRRSTPA